MNIRVLFILLVSQFSFSNIFSEYYKDVFSNIVHEKPLMKALLSLKSLDLLEKKVLSESEKRNLIVAFDYKMSLINFQDLGQFCKTPKGVLALKTCSEINSLAWDVSKLRIFDSAREDFELFKKELKVLIKLVGPGFLIKKLNVPTSKYKRFPLSRNILLSDWALSTVTYNVKLPQFLSIYSFYFPETETEIVPLKVFLGECSAEECSELIYKKLLPLLAYTLKPYLNELTQMSDDLLWFFGSGVSVVKNQKDFVLDFLNQLKERFLIFTKSEFYDHRNTDSFFNEQRSLWFPQFILSRDVNAHLPLTNNYLKGFVQFLKDDPEFKEKMKERFLDVELSIQRTIPLKVEYLLRLFGREVGNSKWDEVIIDKITGSNSRSSVDDLKILVEKWKKEKKVEGSLFLKSLEKTSKSKFSWIYEEFTPLEKRLLNLKTSGDESIFPLNSHYEEVKETIGSMNKIEGLKNKDHYVRELLSYFSGSFISIKNYRIYLEKIKRDFPEHEEFYRVGHFSRLIPTARDIKSFTYYNDDLRDTFRFLSTQEKISNDGMKTVLMDLGDRLEGFLYHLRSSHFSDPLFLENLELSLSLLENMSQRENYLTSGMVRHLFICLIDREITAYRVSEEGENAEGKRKAQAVLRTMDLVLSPLVKDFDAFFESYKKEIFEYSERAPNNLRVFDFFWKIQSYVDFYVRTLKKPGISSGEIRVNLERLKTVVNFSIGLLREYASNTGNTKSNMYMRGTLSLNLEIYMVLNPEFLLTHLQDYDLRENPFTRRKSINEINIEGFVNILQEVRDSVRIKGKYREEFEDDVLKSLFHSLVISSLETGKEYEEALQNLRLKFQTPLKRLYGKFEGIGIFLEAVNKALEGRSPCEDHLKES